MKKTTVFLPLFLAALLILPVGAAHAFSISYTVGGYGSDLDASGSMDDDLLYTFYVSDGTFAVGEGFTVYFDYASFDAVEDLFADIGDWSVLTWPPDAGVPDDGAFDAQALVAGASVADPFTVGVSLTGGPGAATPSSLPFEIYGANFDTLETGRAAPVPEPGTLVLLGAGLIALAGNVRRKGA